MNETVGAVTETANTATTPLTDTLSEATTTATTPPPRPRRPWAERSRPRASLEETAGAAAPPVVETAAPVADAVPPITETAAPAANVPLETVYPITETAPYPSRCCPADVGSEPVEAMVSPSTSARSPRRAARADRHQPVDGRANRGADGCGAGPSGRSNGAGCCGRNRDCSRSDLAGHIGALHQREAASELRGRDDSTLGALGGNRRLERSVTSGGAAPTRVLPPIASIVGPFRDGLDRTLGGNLPVDEYSEVGNTSWPRSGSCSARSIWRS